MPFVCGDIGTLTRLKLTHEWHRCNMLPALEIRFSYLHGDIEYKIHSIAYLSGSSHGSRKSELLAFLTMYAKRWKSSIQDEIMLGTNGCVCLIVSSRCIRSVDPSRILLSPHVVPATVPGIFSFLQRFFLVEWPDPDGLGLGN